MCNMLEGANILLAYAHFCIISNLVIQVLEATLYIASLKFLNTSTIPLITIYRSWYARKAEIETPKSARQTKLQPINQP